jgi:hypothetical protein
MGMSQDALIGASDRSVSSDRVSPPPTSASDPHLPPAQPLSTSKPLSSSNSPRNPLAASGAYSNDHFMQNNDVVYEDFLSSCSTDSTPSNKSNFL